MSTVSGFILLQTGVTILPAVVNRRSDGEQETSFQ